MDSAWWSSADVWSPRCRGDVGLDPLRPDRMGEGVVVDAPPRRRVEFLDRASRDRADPDASDFIDRRRGQGPVVGVPHDVSSLDGGKRDEVLTTWATAFYSFSPRCSARSTVLDRKSETRTCASKPAGITALFGRS